MEVDERPTEQYADIGGLDKQIQEVSRCIHAFEKFLVNYRFLFLGSLV